MSNSSQRVRGKFGSGQRLRAFCKKPRTLWPQLSQCVFAKFKPKGTRKMLFGRKGTRISQKVTNPLAPTAPMVDFCQTRAKGYEENVVRAKGYVHFAKSHIPFGPNCHNGLWQIQAKGHEETVVWAKGCVHFAKSHVLYGPNCHKRRLPSSSQRV